MSLLMYLKRLCPIGCVVVLFAVNAVAANDRPNIIYVLADDLGYGDLSCYGQSTLKTPNLDQMAAEGMRFTRHYAGSTVCAPSRCVLMTGKHIGHASVRGNQGGLILDAEVTIPEMLRDRGYATACVGKWGVGVRRQSTIRNVTGSITSSAT